MNDTTNSENPRSDAGTAAGGTERHSVQTYVSDMLALERHIREPLARQLNDRDAAAFSGAQRVFASIKSMNDNHIVALEAQLDALGGHAASPVKSMWSSLLGVGAAAVDSVRKTRVSKNLRDDSTALSLAAISYTMLHTTALGLGDQTTATLAQRHLGDITPLIVEISRVMPQVVLEELRADGEAVDLSVAAVAEATVADSWRVGGPTGTTTAY
ncbi:MAG: hypothetical protein ABR591_02110 [Candidatus Velthaea sp.]